MGCGSSTVARSPSHASIGSKRSRTDVQSESTEEQVEPDTGLLLSKWIPGFAMEEGESGVTIQTHDDYRGFTVTNANTASKSKTDKLCRWADEALDARTQHGGTFFNPNNPAFWPRDVLVTYDPNALFFNSQSTTKPEQNGGHTRSQQVTLSSQALGRERKKQTVPSL